MTPRRSFVRRWGLAPGALIGLVSMLGARPLAAQDLRNDDAGRTLGAAPSTGSAAGDERVVALNERGSALYAAGEYRRAVESFLQAYAVDQDPNLLFNIASCYEGLGDVDAALEKYRAFLDAPAADPEGRPRAELSIQRLLARSEISSRPPPVVPPPSAGDAVAAPPSVSTALDVPEVGETARRRGDPAWLPWVGLGGGLAFAVTGTAVYLMGRSDHDRVSRAPGFDDPNAVVHLTRARADELVRSGKTKKTIGVSLASVGAALGTGCLVWWLLDPLSEPDSRQVDLTTSGSGATLTWSGRF